MPLNKSSSSHPKEFQWCPVMKLVNSYPIFDFELLSLKCLDYALLANTQRPLHRFSNIDMILMMTVFPGFGGQAFIPDVLPKIVEIRCIIDQRKLPILVEVDGGVKADNINRVVRAGAEVIVSGSGVFKTPNYTDTIRQMRQAAGQA